MEAGEGEVKKLVAEVRMSREVGDEDRRTVQRTVKRTVKRTVCVRSPHHLIRIDYVTCRPNPCIIGYLWTKHKTENHI